MTRLRRSLFVIIALVLSLSAVGAFAQTYPSKPVTVFVPWPPGGRSDLVARITAQFLAEKLGKPVVVVNATGASGVVGARKVSTAAPDGYTLGVFSSGVVATQYTVPAPTDLKDYDPVSLVNMDEAVLAVPAASQFKSLKDLVAYAKANPKKLKLGTAPGTSTGLMAAIFQKGAAVDFLDVPYGGGGQRSAGLAGEHIDIDMDIPAVYKGLMEGKKVRLLGIGAEKRNPLFPDVPTFKEQGVDVVIGTWNGVFAPKGTPPNILDRLSNAVGEVAKDPKFVELMNKSVLGIHYLNHQDFTRFLVSEDASIKAITKELGLQVSHQ
jgi:tripartite-type tricarboxylate transporter receptor subunit TctC